MPTMRAQPVSLGIAASTTITTFAARGPAQWRALTSSLAAYRGTDLARLEFWRLPLSAFLAQSVAQWAWTIVVALSLLASVERRLGRVRFATLVASSHILPTLAVALWATSSGDIALLHVADYGTSCFITGAVGAALWLWRSRALSLVVALGFVGDLFLNSPMTIVEHVLALLIGATFALAMSVAYPTSGTTGRTQDEHAAAP